MHTDRTASVRSITTTFTIRALVEPTGKLKLSLEGEPGLAKGELVLRSPPDHDVDEYAEFVVQDPAGVTLSVGWESSNGTKGTWTKEAGVSTSPVTDEICEMAIIAKPTEPGLLAKSEATTVKIKIKKPGKGD